MSSSISRFFALAAWVALATVAADRGFSAEDTCLVLVGESLGTPNNNYCYRTFSEQKVTIVKGDVLVYEIFQPATNPTPQCALDVNFAGGAYLRGEKCHDATGKSSHPSSYLPESVGRWMPRQLPLTAVVGKETSEWNAALEGDAKGVYVLCLDNIAILHADGSRTVIYSGGPPLVNRQHLRNNYADNVLLTALPRASVTNEGLAQWLAQVRPLAATPTVPVLATPAPAAPAKKVRPKPAAKPLPPPESKVIEEARGLVRDFFKADYTKAASGQREALIARLMKEAAATNTDLDLKYALLDEALSSARQSNRFDLGLEVIDDLAGVFQVNGWAMKMEVLTKATPDDPKDQKAFLACCLEQLEAAADEERYVEAQRIATLAQGYAAKLKDEQALEVLKKQNKTLVERQALFARYDVARKTLEEKPDDAEAHLKVGGYLCFAKEDFGNGLPHLAAGSDPELKALATQELANPAAARLALADRWFELAEKRSGLEKDAMLARAAEHYDAALPNLDDEARAKATKRLAAIRPAQAAGNGFIASLAPVVWLSFDKGSLRQKGEHLVAEDLSGNGNRANIYGASGPGVSGEALVLDGKQTRAVVVDSGKLDFGGKDFTAAVWFRPDALPAREQMIFEKSVWGQHDAFQITLITPSKVRFNYPAIDPGVNHEITLTTGTWYHYAIVVQAGKSLTLYGNGKVVASAPMTHPIAAGSSSIHIGSRAGGTCYFAGAVDDFVLVPRALTAAEVFRLAQRPGAKTVAP